MIFSFYVLWFGWVACFSNDMERMDKVDRQNVQSLARPTVLTKTCTITDVRKLDAQLLLLLCMIFGMWWSYCQGQRLKVFVCSFKPGRQRTTSWGTWLGQGTPNHAQQNSKSVKSCTISWCLGRMEGGVIYITVWTYRLWERWLGGYRCSRRVDGRKSSARHRSFLRR